MALSLLGWFLSSLVVIAVSLDHPLVALALAVVAGCAVGLCRRCAGAAAGRFFRRADAGGLCPRQADAGRCSPHTEVGRWLPPGRVLLLCLPSVGLLAFANRLPLPLALLGLAGLAIGCGGRWLATGRPLAPASVGLPIALLLVWPATAGLWASPDRQLSLQGVLALAAGVGLFCALVAGLRDGPALRRAVWAFVAIGALGAVVGVVALDPARSKLATVRELLLRLPHFGLAANANYVGGTLTLFLPVAFWMAAYPRRAGALTLTPDGARRACGCLSRARVVSALATGLVAVGLLLSQSRGALLATAVALAATAACTARWLRWTIVGLALAAAAGLWMAGLETVLDPVPGSSVESTWAGRRELWQRAVYIGQDFPFTGTGLNTFAGVVDLLYPLFLIGPDARVPHAHSLYLHVFAATGFPGFVALWMLLAAWGAVCWDLLRRTRRDAAAAPWRAAALGLVGGALAFLVYCVTDAVVLWDKAALAWWAAMALTVSLWQHVRDLAPLTATQSAPLPALSPESGASPRAGGVPLPASGAPSSAGGGLSPDGGAPSSAGGASSPGGGVPPPAGGGSSPA